MSTLPIVPFNKSFLSNNKFDFVLKRIPNFTFLVQSVNLPGLTLASTAINTPFSTISVPGNQITFGTLSLTFLVDEDMQAWYELYDWIVQLGNPTGYDKIGRLTGPEGSTINPLSDATLYVKTNSNNPNFKFNFIDVYPTELGEMTFTSSDNSQ